HLKRIRLTPCNDVSWAFIFTNDFLHIVTAIPRRIVLDCFIQIGRLVPSPSHEARAREHGLQGHSDTGLEVPILGRTERAASVPTLSFIRSMTTRSPSG